MSTAHLRSRTSRAAEPNADVRRLWDRVPVQRLARGEYLYLPGAPAEAVFLVRSGSIRLARLFDSGTELTLELAGPGDLVGEGAALGESQRAELAQALEPAEAASLSAKIVELALRRNAGLALDLARIVLKRQRCREARVAESTVGECRRRLASVLLHLCDRFGVDEDGGRRIALRLTHEDLARLIGAVRETVTPLLLSFRKAGAIDYDRRRILIRDPKALVQARTGER